MPSLTIYTPHHLAGNEPPPLEQYGWRFLAEGDSWFTIGALNPAKNSNLLFELAFESTACAVNCAYPGDTLQHMAQFTANPDFANLLAGRTARTWDGLLLSAGGNDLIDALQVRGPGVPPEQRLLLRADEWSAAPGVARYVSEPGWQAFEGYVETALGRIVALRDSGPSRGCPLFMHGYAVPTPRPAPAGLGAGPWLLPALQAYGVPEADQVALAAEFIHRLAALLARLAQALPAVHFFDSTAVPVVPAAPNTTGEDGDWINEIHLTWRGYDKVARPWAAAIEAVLKAR